MEYKIYHNTRCRKSRGGLKYLEDKGIEPEIIEYLKDEPFSEKSLSDVINKLGIKPQELIRTQEAIYKQNYKGKEYRGSSKCFALKPGKSFHKMIDMIYK